MRDENLETPAAFSSEIAGTQNKMRALWSECGLCICTALVTAGAAVMVAGVAMDDLMRGNIAGFAPAALSLCACAAISALCVYATVKYLKGDKAPEANNG